MTTKPTAENLAAASNAELDDMVAEYLDITRLQTAKRWATNANDALGLLRDVSDWTVGTTSFQAQAEGGPQHECILWELKSRGRGNTPSRAIVIAWLLWRAGQG